MSMPQASPASPSTSAPIARYFENDDGARQYEVILDLKKGKRAVERLFGALNTEPADQTRLQQVSLSVKGRFHLSALLRVSVKSSGVPAVEQILAKAKCSFQALEDGEYLTYLSREPIAVHDLSRRLMEIIEREDGTINFQLLLPEPDAHRVLAEIGSMRENLPPAETFLIGLLNDGEASGWAILEGDIGRSGWQHLRQIAEGVGAQFIRYDSEMEPKKFFDYQLHPESDDYWFGA
jgi:hypothetical protein